DNAVASGDRGHWSGQVLRGHVRRRRRRPGRAQRLDLRRAGPQRRRQDDDDPHAGHVDPPRRGHRPRPRPRHRRGGGRRAGRRQPHRPARIGRRGPHRPGEPDPPRPPAGSEAPGGQGPCRRAARRLRAVGGRREAGQELLRRDAAQARHRRQHRGDPRADVPRRADDWPRPPLPKPGLEHHPGVGRRGDHHPAVHAVPRGGGPAGRRDRRHRPGQGDRRGHSRPAKGVGRLRRPLCPPPRSRAAARGGAAVGPRSGRRHDGARPCRPFRRLRRRRPRRRGGRGTRSRRGANRRLLPRPAQPGRGLPGPHRPHRGRRRIRRPRPCQRGAAVM
ncbi:MAG: Efflux ABC transporter, ATP-binding protein, partial [uncultured Acidimicrobiales bacterium]